LVRGEPRDSGLNLNSVLDRDREAVKRTTQVPLRALPIELLGHIVDPE
jgi:hypothetical protein